jgi:hypothetical protein
MSEKPPFVPTHRLKRDIPALKLKAGTLVRQINPFAGSGPNDQLMCLEEGDRTPWLFVPDEVEPLPDWPRIRDEMIKQIGERAGWK